MLVRVGKETFLSVDEKLMEFRSRHGEGNGLSRGRKRERGPEAKHGSVSALGAPAWFEEGGRGEEG